MHLLYCRQHYRVESVSDRVQDVNINHQRPSEDVPAPMVDEANVCSVRHLTGYFGLRRPDDSVHADVASPTRQFSRDSAAILRQSKADDDDDVVFVNCSRPLVKRRRHQDDEAEESSDRSPDEDEDDSFICTDHDSQVSDDGRSHICRTETADWSSIISRLRNRRQFMQVEKCPNCAKFVRYLAKYVQKLSTIQ
jgi:hypothetical protein